ncbi:Nudix hydrolase-like protein [Quillaja saponaria]|uniref:Nudix hydrolase-like protein n=1 Tax=Quillaja saponaria TaxID=32244 RepID=A0AAD7VDF9_QUISA|nr:Nudix hydrolase-like protein [Quillaja saponaria]
MSCFQARTGRDKQRYENNFRLVSGCIPYRLIENNRDHSSDTENKIEVLMVSSPNRDDLVFPKGGWEDDETVLQAASREALEEAGVRGILREKPLGRWDFRSKSSQDICSLQGGCRGSMFALEVTEELETWPEKGNRDRKWISIQDAFRLCRYEWMRMALEEFLKVMAEDGKLMMQIAIMPNSMPVSDVKEDCQIIPSSCYIKTSTTQHHVGFCNESLVSSNSFQFEKEQTVK